VVHVHNGVFSVIKKNLVLSLVAKWIEQDEIMLSETSQIRKDKHCVLSYICKPKKLHPECTIVII
jgi:hypothetical protein